MRFTIFLFSVYVVIVQGKAQYQPYFKDSFYPNPSNQYPNNYPISDGRTPNLANNNRFLFASLLLTTITTTTTTTTTTTCTVSTASTCNTTGRKRRALEEDEENIEPSPVNEVEPTIVPEIESVIRKERKPDLQFAYGRADFPLYELQSTIDQRLLSNNYNPYLRRPMIVGDPKFFPYPYFSYTTTTTSTVTTTFRSTPICSQASSFNKC